MGLDGRASTTTTRSSPRTCGTDSVTRRRTTLEKPDLLDLIGSAVGLRVRTSGAATPRSARSCCGRQPSYLGVEPSQNMVGAARETLAGRRPGRPGNDRGVGVPDVGVRPGDLPDGAALRRGRRGDVRRVFLTGRRAAGSSSRWSTRSSRSCDRACTDRSARTGSWTTTTSRQTRDQLDGPGRRQVPPHGREYFDALASTGFLVEGLREGRPRASCSCARRRTSAGCASRSPC